MKKPIRFLPGALACLILLSGCARGAPDPTATPADDPTPALTATPEPTPEPTPQPTPTPEPSPAPEPAPTPAPTPASKQDLIPFEEGQQYAAAWLGYQQMDDLDYYLDRYLDSRPPVCHISDGDYYLVIPRYSGTALELFVNDVETSEGSLLLEVPDCGPFIVQCNASDVFEDATIRLTHEGTTAEFSPFISLMDGSVQIGEYGLDLTKTEDAGG